MKDQFEHSIKESLQGFEAPYNPAAWDAMRAQLDAKMPVNSPPKGGTAKWYIAAAVITGIGVGSYFLLNSDENGANTTAQTETTSDAGENNAGNSSTISENHSATNVETDGDSQIGPSSDQAQGQTADGGNIPVNNAGNPIPNGNRRNDSGFGPDHGQGDNASGNDGHAGNPNPSNNSGHEVTNIEVKLPEMENVCQNSIVTINNTNKVPLILIGPDVYQMIPAKESAKIRMKKAGEYFLSEYKNEKGKRVQFTVKSAPIADFSIDPMTKFEEGLPTTKLAANVPGTQFEWIINGERTYGTEVDAHFYRQGTHDVTLVVTGSNGCEALQTKSVYIEDNYNLIAPSSFRPLSNDLSVSRFIPYALTERNVNFKMIIVDPADGHVLFETKDASMGWDGIDRKTGQLVPFERVYIWKVTLDKAAKFEQRTEYSGQVIPVRTN